MKPYSEPSPSSQGERATHDDRELTASLLGDALARGALDATEHEQRQARALSASHVAQLTALTSDLPRSVEANAASKQYASDLSEWLKEWRWWLGGAVILTAIWGLRAISAGPSFYWPIFPLGVWAAVLVAIAIWPGKKVS